ncbi:CBS domain-containing protein [Candidatus Micrarchaeota archaeon]|nr:CBS domain-containing protein [Candidatus Micrarchaeota archaeon]
MLPELAQVKLRRLKLGVKQGELAKQAGVSQSMIAKIESNRITPSYENARKVFAALEKAEAGKQQTAADLMTRTVHYVKEGETVEEASKLMRGKNISQLPVLKGPLIVGSISDKTIVDKINEGVNVKELKAMRVHEVMEDPMPVVQENTPVRAIYSLLEFAPALVVKNKDKIAGIVSRSDLLKLR